ncbi:hypothetical protein Taro_046079, partial [Colocasia esculenta]|nr:hypothetical protein [Colocasia esculenta]
MVDMSLGQNSRRSVCTSTPTAVPSGHTRIFIRPGVGTAREAPIQNWHFDPVESVLQLGRHKVKFGDFQYGAQIRLRERGRNLPMRMHTDTPSFKIKGITFRLVIGIVYKTTIRNCHLEVLVACYWLSMTIHRFRLEKPPFRAPKLRFQPTISTFPNNVSIDDANYWWGHNMESAYHDDRMLCSTRRENSFPHLTSPSMTRITGGATTRSQPIMKIKSCVQLGARTPSQ